MATVAVVGAGLAGLTAAFRLTQMGHAVTLFEATHRVGGRIRSVTMENGAVAELGGEWIRGDHVAVSSLADEVGESLVEVGVDFGNRDLIGAPPIPPEEHRRVARLVEDAVHALSPVERQRTAAAEILRDLDDGSDAFVVLRRRIVGSAAVPARFIGVDEMIGDFGVGEADYVRVAGGNDRLPASVARKLPEIRLGSPLSVIGEGETTVSLRIGGEWVTADGGVVAVPLAQLSTIDMHPRLGNRLAPAVSGLRMGRAAKQAVATRSAPPLFGRQNGDASWWAWTGKGSDGATLGVVTAFAGTTDAVEVLEDGGRGLLLGALPDVDFAEEVEFIDWGREKWFKGCYSSLGPGQDELLDGFNGTGGVVFAGEHTTGSGTIEGAIASGEMAATRLHQYLTGAAAGPGSPAT